MARGRPRDWEQGPGGWSPGPASGRPAASRAGAWPDRESRPKPRDNRGYDVGDKVVDGIYRIGIDNEHLLTIEGKNPVRLLPQNGRGQEWEVKSIGNGTYTIRGAEGQEFLGFDGAPDTFEPVRPCPEAREWRIEPGPRPGTFTIGVVDDQSLTLGLHPALIYPPLIALSPIFREDRGWALEKIS